MALTVIVLSAVNSYQNDAHLLPQRTGTDGTWLWVQPSSGLVLGLQHRNSLFIRLFRVRSYQIKSLNKFYVLYS